MPLDKIEITEPGCGWAIWHLTETEIELFGTESCSPDITNPVKRREWLAGRKLMRLLTEKTGLEYHGIIKDDFGKPFLKDHPHQISLSHSFPYVAVQIDHDHAVGIDIEKPKIKLLNIAPRIFSAKEIKDAGTDLKKNCIYWCAKECLYKIYGQKGLSFIEHLFVSPFSQNANGEIDGTIAVDGQVLSYILHYEVTPDFVLVRTKKKTISNPEVTTIRNLN